MNYVAHMKISEYIIRPDLPVPVEVIDKIQVYHANPMSYIRELFGYPITVSRRSGFRPREHEVEKGRTGLLTEHLFEPLDRPGSERGLGAADYTASLKMMPDLAKLIIEHSGYSRITFYPDAYTPFFHCDYRYGFATTRTYIATNSWTEVSKEAFLAQANKTAKVNM